MASNPPGACCTVGTLHEGTPTGKDIKIDDGKVDAYLATPPEGKGRDGVGILYIADIIGIWQNSKLMADQFALKGYTTLVPDIFNGDPAPLNQPDGFDLMNWISVGTGGNNPHTPPFVDAITEKAIKAMKDLGITKIGAVGYCFGAKFVLRHYKNGIDVGFLAHPSFTTEEELAGIGGPLSIAAAEEDPIFPVEKRHESEVILSKTGKPYQITLYSGTQHGFAVRGDPKIKLQKFAKEQAFWQAVTWFNEFL